MQLSPSIKSIGATGAVVVDGEDQNAAHFQMEISVHTCSTASVTRELKRIFPQRDAGNLLAIATFQPSQTDLVSIGATIEEEKDELLEKFFKFAEKFVNDVAAKGYWADYIDPCSGYPMKGERFNAYAEAPAMHELLKYEFHNVGCCDVISHPRWHTRCYPATLFTDAPLNVIQQLLHI